MKPPIWERQGRPKPPEIGTSPVPDYYSLAHRRWSICRRRGGGWQAYAPGGTNPGVFPTFAEAIAYADRKARR